MFYILLLCLLITYSSARLCNPAIQPTLREGYKLTGHHITTYPYIGDREVCIEACTVGNCCYSVNFYHKKKKCELNKQNHVYDPKNMTEASDSEYIDCPMRSWSCSTALGMEDKRISDNQITASSAYSSSNGSAMHAYNGRLNHMSTHEKKMTWATKFNDQNQWLQVDLLHRVHVCAIATQGLDVYAQWVKTYSLQYNDDGVVFTDYNQGHIFQGNSNNKVIVKNDLIPAIVARYIRVLPKSWQWWIAMRIELYGCEA